MAHTAYTRAHLACRLCVCTFLCLLLFFLFSFSDLERINNKKDIVVTGVSSDDGDVCLPRHEHVHVRTPADRVAHPDDPRSDRVQRHRAGFEEPRLWRRGSWRDGRMARHRCGCRRQVSPRQRFGQGGYEHPALACPAYGRSESVRNVNVMYISPQQFHPSILGGLCAASRQ
jgi:hypothetical protein